MHMIAELLLSFRGKVIVKGAYFFGREFLQRMKSKNYGINLEETMAEKTRFEVEFPTMDISSIKDHMTRDKVRRVIVTSQRDCYTSLEFYALTVAKGVQNSEKRTLRKEFKSRWSQRWLKNHTYGLVRLPKQKRVIRIKWMQVARSRFKVVLNLIKVVE